MVRPLVPKKDRDSSRSPPGGQPADQKSNKRRCVPSACVPCRKRKSKCDGATPVCATCTAVYKTECYYDAESESRRKTAVKRDSSVLRSDRASAAEFILSSIKTLSDGEIQDVIQQIRADDDLEALADSIRKTALGTPASRGSTTPSMPLDFSSIMARPLVMNSGVTRVWGHTAGLGLVLEDDKDTGLRAPSAIHEQATWTTVTDNKDFVLELLDYYFTWAHPFYQVVSRKHFYEDFYARRTKFCSSLLVNAMCAFACHYVDRPEARKNPKDSRTAGDMFFDEAKKLLFQDENPSLTTVQALAVMSLREPSMGRDSSGFMYSGRSLRMALEIGLHLSLPDHHNTDPIEDEVRGITFWGCFVLDTAWSLCIGRISQLPRAAITVKKPCFDDPQSADPPWRPKPDIPGLDLNETSQTNLSRHILYQLSLLSELVNDTVFMFYAPKERFTSRRLLDTYARYRAWYRDLPSCLRIQEGAVPTAAVLETLMYYHTCVLHLFKPIMRMELTSSDIVPRQVCVDCANEISEMMKIYRRLYGLRRVNLVITHIALSAGIVHLLNAGDKLSEENLAQSLKDLESMSECHFFAARCFKIIVSLAHQYHIPIPQEVLRDSALIRDGNAALLSPMGASPFFPTNSTTPPENHQGGQLGDSSHSQYQSNHNSGISSYATRSPYPPTSGISASDASAHCLPGTFAMHNLIPHHPAPTHSQAGSQPASTQRRQYEPAFPASQPMPGDLFWAPIGFAGQGVPIIGSGKTSPMDIPSLLVNTDSMEQLYRDGFKLSTDWHLNHDQQRQKQQSFHGNQNTHVGGPVGSEIASYGTTVTAVTAVTAATTVPSGYQGGQWYRA